MSFCTYTAVPPIETRPAQEKAEFVPISKSSQEGKKSLRTCLKRPGEFSVPFPHPSRRNTGHAQLGSENSDTSLRQNREATFPRKGGEPGFLGTTRLLAGFVPLSKAPRRARRV